MQKPENCVHVMAFSTAFLVTGLPIYLVKQSYSQKLLAIKSPLNNFFLDLKVFSQVWENLTKEKGKKIIYFIFLGFLPEFF